MWFYIQGVLKKIDKDLYWLYNAVKLTVSSAEYERKKSNNPASAIIYGWYQPVSKIFWRNVVMVVFLLLQYEDVN